MSQSSHSGFRFHPTVDPLSQRYQSLIDHSLIDELTPPNT
jgi:hypothetical protein